MNSVIKEGLLIRNVVVRSELRKASKTQFKPGIVIASLKKVEDKCKVMAKR